MFGMWECAVWRLWHVGGWAYVDGNIKTRSSQCEACKITVAIPAPVAQYPYAPWERVHVDFGEWNKTSFLVLVDVFSKWPEVKWMSSISTQKTIEVLNDIFATHGSSIWQWVSVHFFGVWRVPTREQITTTITLSLEWVDGEYGCWRKSQLISHWLLFSIYDMLPSHRERHHSKV